MYLRSRKRNRTADGTINYCARVGMFVLVFVHESAKVCMCLYTNKRIEPTFARRLRGSRQEGGSASCARSGTSCCRYSSNMDAS